METGRHRGNKKRDVSGIRRGPNCDGSTTGSEHLQNDRSRGVESISYYLVTSVLRVVTVPLSARPTLFLYTGKMDTWYSV